MTREQFNRLEPGSTCFAHVGTSYRRVTVVAVDRESGLVSFECRALGHGSRLLSGRRPFGEIDRRAYKPYPGLRWNDGRRFAARVR